MSEIKNIHEHASWFASYEDSDQAKALILCQKAKIGQLQRLVELIKGEIELTEAPQEYSHKSVLESIKGLIENIPAVSHTEGYFKWEG